MRFVVLAIGLTGPAVVAADPAFECSMDAASQAEIGACVAEAEQRVGAALDLAFGIAMSSAEELDVITEREVGVPALEAAQAAWLAYRDAQCEFAGTTFGGGSGTGIAIGSCRVELGRARIRELLASVP